MDLALHLGKTAGEVEREMTGVEFNLWQRYANRRMLPWRRMELLLAQVSQIIGATMGGAGDKVLSDYLFDPPEESPGGADEDEAATFFAFAPRNKKE